MTTIFQVRVEAVEGPHLALHVDHVYGWDWERHLVASPTMALHFLWDPLQGYIRKDIPFPDGGRITWEEANALALTLPLGQALAGRDSTDSRWNRANVGRFISCAGVVDRQHHYEMWNDTNHDGWYCPRHVDRSEVETAKATYLIAATDPCWLAHLAPGMEWDSTAYAHDEKVVVDPGWRTSTVLALARQVSESCDFSAMPILADALQDAGCADEQILGHCRSRGPHVRGCWVLDLLLPRSRFDPRTLDATSVQHVGVALGSPDGGEDQPPEARSADHEDIAAVVTAVRSAQEMDDDRDMARGVIRFSRRDEEPGELWFFPDRDPEWYGLRTSGQTYRIRRTGFAGALGRLGIELPPA